MAHRSISAARLATLLGSSTHAAPAYRGIADGLRLLIADGQVPAGTRLPSERELTAALGVSRTTVTHAYARLRESGYASARRGSGTVASLPSASGRRHGTPLLPLDGTDQSADGTIDLTCAAMPAPPGTAAAYEAAAAALPAYLDGTGYHALGLPALRERIAERFTARGLPTTADQVLITPGALSGLAATLRALLSAGDRVLMESPTYPNAIAAARSSGARPLALPIDGSGWDTGALEATLRQTAPRAAYLMPDYQNPTGALMVDRQRETVGAALSRTHTLAVIDETLADLGRPGTTVHPRPLAAYTPNAVTLGSSSKVYWGGVRVGWLRAPVDLMPSLTEARLTLDLGTPVLEQLVLMRLMDDEAAILRSRVEHLAISRAALAEALGSELPQWRFSLPAGGLSLWVQLPEAMSTALTLAAERHGVLLAPGPQFAVEGGLERWLRLPCTRSPDVLREAVRRLAVASRDLAEGAGVPRRARPALIA